MQCKKWFFFFFLICCTDKQCLSQCWFSRQQCSISLLLTITENHLKVYLIQLFLYLLVLAEDGRGKIKMFFKQIPWMEIPAGKVKHPPRMCVQTVNLAASFVLPFFKLILCLLQGSIAHFLPSVRRIDVTYQAYFGPDWRRKKQLKKKKARPLCLLEGLTWRLSLPIPSVLPIHCSIFTALMAVYTVM